MKVKFSIRYKFLAVTTALLIFCVGVYLFMATVEFKADKRSLVFDYNKSLVVNISSDIESYFSDLSNKLRTVAFYSHESESRRKLLISEMMKEKQDLVLIAVSSKFAGLDKIFYEDQDFDKTYGIADGWWQTALSEQRNIPFQKIQIDGEAFWNATIPNGPGLIGFGKSVVEVDEQGVPQRQYAVIGYVKTDRIIKSLVGGQPNEVYVTTTEGELLAHADSTRMISNLNLSADKLYQIAKSGKVKKKVVEFAAQNEKFLGAFSYAFKDKLLVLSKITEANAFHAANRLIFRSLVFASMIITLAFLVAIFFSRSLTKPIEVLVQGMARVATGDLKSQIQVSSRDEVASLAASFNNMIVDLRKSREELESINRELESKVKARTKDLELQNRAVKDAQEALLRTTRLAAVGEVAGQTAHEILNPLTSIVSRLNKLNERLGVERTQEAQVLLDISNSWSADYAAGGYQSLIKNWQEPSKLNPAKSLFNEDTENIRHIGENILAEFNSLKSDTSFLLSEATRISRIVNSFRNLSNRKSECSELSIHLLCEKAIRIMADMAEKENIKVVTNFKATQDVVFLDEDEFIQVMTNLLRNSLHSVASLFKQSEGGEILISSEVVNDEIQIGIQDNGAGISEENKNRLFEKHFTTKSKQDGTGIGLSISRRIVRGFKGDIYLTESKSGAHFIIKLPLAVAPNKRGVA